MVTEHFAQQNLFSLQQTDHEVAVVHHFWRKSRFSIGYRFATRAKTIGFICHCDHLIL